MASRYEAGFTACVAEVGRYLTASVDVVPQLSAVLPHLVDHLAGCLRHRRRRRRRTAPTSLLVAAADDDDDDSSVDCEHARELQLAERHQPPRDELSRSILQASSVSSW